jgi:hypothetical protein
MRACFCGGMGPLRGLATKRCPHERQRKVGVPAELTPLRTTWVAAQREQGGTEIGSTVVGFILPVYHHAAQKATT